MYIVTVIWRQSLRRCRAFSNFSFSFENKLFTEYPNDKGTIYGILCYCTFVLMLIVHFH